MRDNPLMRDEAAHEWGTRQTQIPFGDDNKKGKGKSKGNSNSYRAS